MVHLQSKEEKRTGTASLGFYHAFAAQKNKQKQQFCSTTSLGACQSTQRYILWSEEASMTTSYNCLVACLEIAEGG